MKRKKVVKIIRTPSGETASLDTVARYEKSKNRVQLSRDEHLWYDVNTGREIDPAPGFTIGGISSRIIFLES